MQHLERELRGLGVGHWLGRSRDGQCLAGVIEDVNRRVALFDVPANGPDKERYEGDGTREREPPSQSMPDRCAGGGYAFS